MLNGEFLATTTKSIELAQVSARTYDRIFNLKKPTVAVVEGYAVAGGFELMISCDFCVAASDAQIGDFHIRRALFGGAGPIYRLPRYIGLCKAKELMLTGRVVSGAESAAIGLSNLCVPDDELDAKTEELASAIVANSWFSLRAVKRLVNEGQDHGLSDGLAFERDTSPGAGPDMQERLKQFKG